VTIESDLHCTYCGRELRRDADDIWKLMAWWMLGLIGGEPTRFEANKWARVREERWACTACVDARLTSGAFQLLEGAVIATLEV
jgi:ribosomal protein L37AE/L43A